MNYEDDIINIKGIGEKTAKLFNKVSVYTVGDLIEYVPRTYDIYKPIMPISNAEGGMIVTVEGFICDSVKIKKIRTKTILTCRIKDSTDSIMVTWFNMPYLKNSLTLGSRVILRGSVTKKNGMRILEQPKILSKDEYLKKLGLMSPIYPLTAGLTNTIVSKAVSTVLSEINLDKDYLPASIRKEKNLLEYRKAVKTIHFPKNMKEMLKARERLVFDEFFIFALSVCKLKENRKKEMNSFEFSDDSLKKSVEFIENLPYKLTNAQLKTINEIKADLKSNYVMNRLVQGDVGSGKTIVALIALYITALSGYQGVIMAPTEVLALQHYESFNNMFEENGIDVKVGILVGSMTAKEKKIAYEKIKNQEYDIIVGTHALIQEKVEYANLALVITDEQHRFGVKQREKLADKGNEPHVLVMSATPIPRTLAIILYGDLDISVIDEMPANRIPIKNCVVDTSYRSTAYKFISNQISQGRQAYIICPMVEESENLEGENVIDYVEKLRMEIPPFINVEALHGKMKPKEKNEIMERFSKNETQVLVSTTVIEVGVNVPNATVMMVENADRFGLAQLHQLRGRVGRGKYQSYCIFMSGNESKQIKKRLETLSKSNDGFYIANEDLKLRGPGDLFGIRQSGELGFKIADVFNDANCLKEANEAAKGVKLDDVRAMMEENSRVAKKIENYTGNTVL